MKNEQDRSPMTDEPVQSTPHDAPKGVNVGRRVFLGSRDSVHSVSRLATASRIPRQRVRFGTRRALARW